MTNIVRFCNIIGFIALFALSVIIIPPIWLSKKQADILAGFTEWSGLDYDGTYIAGMILMHFVIATSAFILIKLLAKWLAR